MMNELGCAEAPLPFSRWIRRMWTTLALSELLALAILVFVFVPQMDGRHRMHCGLGDSKVDIAKLEAQKLANEAYPQWRRANRSQTCPSSLAALFPYDDRQPAWDPWGSPYSFDCVGKHIVVRSPGEDRQYGTTDDIRSDE